MRNRPERHHLPIYDRSGVLLVNKPRDWTSHDVVAFVRSRFNVPKCGHCGTLDPAATGLLVVVLGKFTKLSQKFSGEDKTYEGTILLGTETDSQDMDGNIIRQNDWSGVTEAQLRDAFASFVGDIEQIPPMVSAVKKGGERLYDLARKGQEIEREPKPITIYSIDISRVALPYADFTVSCSKGTYIRTLCADVGAKLGCGAALYRLNRLRSGEFSLDDAVDIETVKQWTQDDLDNWVTGFLHNRLARMTHFSTF
ncbi:MAG: tRNA pseudouridine(55) synthase TruB [Lentisphaeria bacterium]|nr:tRNA pseudouridine(55) synthase TruB [Lentisphaeria bacterium]